MALAVCAADPVANVFVAARLGEGVLRTNPGGLLGYRDDDGLRALCWSAANVVPVGCRDEAFDAFAMRLRRWRHRCASIFGPVEQVMPLWERLEPLWGAARAVRPRQPLMVARRPPSSYGVHELPWVRRATPAEVDIVLPAAATMFTGEIGYPPYRGSSSSYRQVLLDLISRGHTYVWIRDGQVVFKADVGSVAMGVAQIQGVWLARSLRGQGLGTAAMAAVTEQVMAGVAPTVSLYVNDFNEVARSVYARVGFAEVGTFATVLL